MLNTTKNLTRAATVYFDDDIFEQQVRKKSNVGIEKSIIRYRYFSQVRRGQSHIGEECVDYNMFSPLLTNSWVQIDVERVDRFFFLMYIVLGDNLELCSTTKEAENSTHYESSSRFNPTCRGFSFVLCLIFPFLSS